MCKACAVKARPVTWAKNPEELRRNQGAYKSYCKAKQRVKTNHKNAYANVEFRFESYEQFLSELGPRPAGKTLDRIDNTGHYEPGNVRWATVGQQCRNRSNNVMILYNEELMCMTDAARVSGMPYGTLERRIKAGCPPSHLFVKGRWRYKNGQLADIEGKEKW